MKKIFLSFILIMFWITTPIYAETTTLKETGSTSFNLAVSDILYYKDIKKTQFSLKIEEITHSQNIAYWKFRAYCDDKMIIQLNASSTNDCNKIIRLNSINNDMIPFLYKNKTNKSKDFSIKIKAYDKHGKGLHYEKIGFGWK